jgi:hypothetical protein
LPTSVWMRMYAVTTSNDLPCHAGRGSPVKPSAKR